MPDPVRSPALSRRTSAPGAVVVQPGDSLSAIAARVLGSAGRWRELHEANRDRIGDDPRKLRVGQALRIPGAPASGAVAPPAAPAPAVAVPQPGGAPADRDGDGLIDRYDAAPDDARNRRWNQAAATEYQAFVKARVGTLRLMGAEIDCADLAMKLLFDFCKAVGIPNPMGPVGENWREFSPQRTGGLPNVKGPTFFLPQIGADQLAKGYTRRVNDADGDGVAGFDSRTGKVDVGDLQPGDILFYDWEGDGKVNHTVNVVEVGEDGTVVLAFGSYDNLGTGDVTWANLDITPIERLELKPGTPEHAQWLGEGSGLWGARRYAWMPDRPATQERQ
ncbi:MAG: LysM peptidoglycan-binding domain-containing protein [Candidatus Sericytochromatia bacterium]|nr:LysM peptidoglycan-binding domain-containing protein [Candidatus Sericytochromatia bacterium]